MTDAAFVSMLNNVFTLYRLERLPNGSGGWQESFVNNGSVIGRMAPASGRERDVGDQQRREITHTFYTTYPAQIDRGDKLVLGLHEWEVLGIREPSLAGEHLEIDCRLIEYQETDDGS